jgi:hypothetical protein
MVRELALISQVWSPRLLFLCETRHNKNKMRCLCHRLGLKDFAGVSSDGLSGGLALFWHEQLIIDIQVLMKGLLLITSVSPLLLRNGALLVYTVNHGLKIFIACGIPSTI